MTEMRNAPLVLVWLMAACGPKAEAPKVAAAAPSADAGALAPPSDAAVPALPLPDVRLPPRAALGSPLAEVRPKPEWATCRAIPPAGADPRASLDALASACGARAHLRPLPIVLEGSATASDPARTSAIRVEAGRCYRVVATAAETVQSLVVVLKDSERRPLAAFDKDELSRTIEADRGVCFRGSGGAELSVAVGRGQGAFAVTLWQD